MPKLTAELTTMRELHEDQAAVLNALSRTLNAMTEVAGLAVAQCDLALRRGREINRGYGDLAAGRGAGSRGAGSRASRTIPFPVTDADRAA
jgi:hypothetical protein